MAALFSVSRPNVVIEARCETQDEGFNFFLPVNDKKAGTKLGQIN
jgi:hypothetical protein